MNPLSPVIRLCLFAIAWFSWMLAFAVRRKGGQQAVQMEPKARWGILLEMAGFFCVFMHRPRMHIWDSELAVWRALLGVVFAIPAILMAWSAVGHLGRQWRIDAGLNADHELVQTGAYRVVRHPIYASMLGMLLASICWVGTLPGWPLGVVLFVVGTEIRVRVEDGLLLARFGQRFSEWRLSVPAYLPFLR